MNKTQLIDTLAARFEGDRKQAAQALEAVIDTITREVAKGEKVGITGFGAFEKRVRAARWVRNPRTGERIKAKKTAVPKFSAGADLKAVVSGRKKLPKLTLSAAAKKGTSASTTAASKTSNTGTAKKAPAEKTVRKATVSKATSAKKAPAKKATAKKATAKKATVKATPAEKTRSTRKAPATKTTAKKSTAKKS